METTVEKSEHFKDILTCSICLETFKKPKYLPCLHTFCKSCISTFIVSTVDTEKKDISFNCPVCRTSVVVGDVKPVKFETWAEQLPDNNFLTSLIDRQAIQRKEKICDSCQINNKTEKALSWCTDCDEAFCGACELCHKSFKVTAKHQIVALQDIDNNKVTGMFSSSSINCREHPKEIIKAYCVDHSAPLCTLCATLVHRKCDKIVTIEEAATGIKEATHVKTLLENLKEKKKQIGDLKESRQKCLSIFEKDAEKIVERIKEVKNSVIEHLNALEETIIREVNTSKKQGVIRLTDETTQLSSLHCTVDNWTHVLDTCFEHGSELQCLLEISKITSQSSKFDDDVNNCLKHVKDISINFEPDSAIAEFSSKITSFGEIKSSESTHLTNISKINFQTGIIKIVRVIQVDSRVHSGLYLQDMLLFVQYYNKQIIKYNHKGDQTAKLELPDSLTDIAQITATESVVSSNGQALFIVNIRDMTLVKTLTVSSSLWGICYVDGEFISARGSNLLRINATSGAVIKTQASKGGSYYLHATNNTDYIWGGHSSVTKTVNGSIAFFYTSPELSGARGIDIDMDGNIYVCGYLSQNVHQLTKDGEVIRIIPSSEFGIRTPWILRFQKDSNKFFVTCFNSNKVVICEIVQDIQNQKKKTPKTELVDIL